MHAYLAPDRLLTAYASGIFPMADEDGEIRWLAPDPRAILEFDSLSVSRSLRTLIGRGVYEVTLNREFSAVIAACADRDEGTWISAQMQEAYRTLHFLGFAHSMESWKDGELAGGLYGVAIGGAFFGESMFHRVSNASKVAFVELVGRLRERGFALLDVQFVTDHLRSLGATEIPKAIYDERLQEAVRLPCSFCDSGEKEA